MMTKVRSMIMTPELLPLFDACVELLPSYWYTVPASSSGKYHPAFAAGEGGLMKHSYATTVFARRIATAYGWDQKHIDLITIAAWLHDGKKQGEGEGRTVHEHPVLMANAIRAAFPGNPDAEFIAHAIESHMGKWNTSKYSDVILPIPMDEAQKVLSAADMCAATPELGFDFDR